MGLCWIHPSVRPSVFRLVFWNFLKKKPTKLLAQSISYLVLTLMALVSWWTPIHLFVYLSSISALWWPNTWPKCPEPFGKKIFAQFISNLTFPLMGWVSWLLFIFVFLTSISALWWQNIWAKMGFRNFLKLLAQFNSYMAVAFMEGADGGLEPYWFSCS